MMPGLTEALTYADDPARSEDELRRACEILDLPVLGTADELRARLRLHLAAMDSERPVVCLNPGPVAARAGRGGPRIARPQPDDFAPVFDGEIALVPEVPDFAALLQSQLEVTKALASTFGESHAGLRAAPGKWSVREMIGHLSDCERVLSYRLLCALRQDETVLPGFDHEAWVGRACFEERRLADVVLELSAVRSATVSLVRSAPERDFGFRLRVGQGSITAAAIAYLIAGHERHHQQLLRSSYLPLLPPAVTGT